MNTYGQRLTDLGEDFRVADRLEIMDLLWRFLMALDIGDREMFEACFTDTVIWDLSNNPVPFTGGPADKGPAEFSRADFVDTAFRSAGDPSRERFMQHCVNNPLVTFTGVDEATVLAHLRNPFHAKAVNAQGELEASDRMLAGLYHVDARRGAGRWRLSALRLAVYAYDPATMGGRR
jgi:hypothetical protein